MATMEASACSEIDLCQVLFTAASAALDDADPDQAIYLVDHAAAVAQRCKSSRVSATLAYATRIMRARALLLLRRFEVVSELLAADRGLLPRYLRARALFALAEYFGAEAVLKRVIEAKKDSRTESYVVVPIHCCVKCTKQAKQTSDKSCCCCCQCACVKNNSDFLPCPTSCTSIGGILNMRLLRAPHDSVILKLYSTILSASLKHDLADACFMNAFSLNPLLCPISTSGMIYSKEIARFVDGSNDRSSFTNVSVMLERSIKDTAVAEYLQQTCTAEFKPALALSDDDFSELEKTQSNVTQNPDASVTVSSALCSPIQRPVSNKSPIAAPLRGQRNSSMILRSNKSFTNFNDSADLARYSLPDAPQDIWRAPKKLRFTNESQSILNDSILVCAKSNEHTVIEEPRLSDETFWKIDTQGASNLNSVYRASSLLLKQLRLQAAVCLMISIGKAIYIPQLGEITSSLATASPKLEDSLFLLQLEGRKYFDQAKYACAVACFERARARDPWLIRDMHYHATSLWFLQQDSELVALSHALCKISSDAPETWFAAACVHSLRGAHDVAVNALKRAVTKYPRFAAAHAMLGYELNVCDNAEDAIQSFKKAINVDPRNVSALSGLGLLLYESRKLPEAFYHFERAEKVSASPTIKYHLTNVCFALNDLNLATSVLQRAIQGYPDNPALLLCRARLLILQNQHGEAQKLLETMRGKHRNEANVLYLLGQLYQRQGDITHALDCLYEASALYGRDAPGMLRESIQTLSRGIKMQSIEFTNLGPFAIPHMPLQKEHPLFRIETKKNTMTSFFENGDDNVGEEEEDDEVVEEEAGYNGNGYGNDQDEYEPGINSFNEDGLDEEENNNSDEDDDNDEEEEEIEEEDVDIRFGA